MKSQVRLSSISFFPCLSGVVVIYLEISPIGFDKMVIIFHRIMKMLQNFQETSKTKLYQGIPKRPGLVIIFFCIIQVDPPNHIFHVISGERQIGLISPQRIDILSKISNVAWEPQIQIEIRTETSKTCQKRVIKIFEKIKARHGQE